jgi:hypothetical protein
MSIQSVSYTPKPNDRRCRFWCKVISSDEALPAPGDVDGANGLPSAYMRQGEEIELFEGDAVLKGEANHHSKARGWSYSLGLVKDGKLIWLEEYKLSCVKKFLREHEDRDGLRGSGDIAAMVRFLRALRSGMHFDLSAEEI